MKEKIVPYTGITGVMAKEDVRAVLDARSPWSKRKIMIGVLASSKTINGELNGQPDRYPTPEQMGSIFEDHSKALNLVHFSTKDPGVLFEDMVKAFTLAGPYCHGLQLNIAWPDSKAIEHFRIKAYPATIVLQIGARAFETIEHSPQKLADKIDKEYKYFIDYVLLDPSGGMGKPLDPEDLRGYLRALGEKEMSVGLGVAGGLSPSTLYDLLFPLATDFPDLSIDVETGVRDENDRLDTNLAISFIKKAECLFE